MNAATVFLHLINGLFPALFVPALVTGLAGRWIGQSPRPWRWRWGLNVLLCVLVVLGFLVFKSQDGTMAMYLTLVLVSASCEWALHTFKG